MALLLTFCGGIAGNNLALSWLVTLLTTLGVFMKGWVDVRNTARKEEMSRFAYTNHEKTLIELHMFARGVVPTELTGFLIKQQTAEDLITDFAPCKRTSFATAATVATALPVILKGVRLSLKHAPKVVTCVKLSKKGIKKVKRKQQKGGALNRRKPRTVDNILEGAAMFLSGPSPSFPKLEILLGKQAIKGIRDNVRHYKH